jgi:hypothetical protein
VEETMTEPDPLIVPDDDVPEDETAEPADADTDHFGLARAGGEG